jgi:flavorubredoxin
MSRITRLHDTTIALTDIVPIDERITWHVPGLQGFEPYNEYLIENGDRVLLIDGGIALHAESIISTLREQVGRRKLYLYGTRIELECIGNFGRLLAAFPEAELVTANVVPLAALFHMPDFSSTNVPITHMSMGDTLAQFGFPHIKIWQGPLRMLGTSWLWDERSRILFTTDFFNTDMLGNGNESVVRTALEGMPQPDHIYRTLLRKFDWLPAADTSTIERDWNTLFANVDPVMIAPIHGRVQSGPLVVKRAIENHRIASFEQRGVNAAKPTAATVV